MRCIIQTPQRLFAFASSSGLLTIAIIKIVFQSFQSLEIFKNMKQINKEVINAIVSNISFIITVLTLKNYLPKHLKFFIPLGIYYKLLKSNNKKSLENNGLLI
jgi:hypothetical protein